MLRITRRGFVATLVAFTVALAPVGCSSNADPDPQPKPAPKAVMVGVFRLLLDGSRAWDLKPAPADKQGISHGLDLSLGDLNAAVADLVLEDSGMQNYLEGVYPLKSPESVGQEFINAATESRAEVEKITSFPGLANAGPPLSVSRFKAPGDVLTVFSVKSKGEATPEVVAIVVRQSQPGRVRPYQVLTITVTPDEKPNGLNRELGFMRMLLQATKDGARR